MTNQTSSQLDVKEGSACVDAVEDLLIELQQHSVFSTGLDWQIVKINDAHVSPSGTLRLPSNSVVDLIDNHTVLYRPGNRFQSISQGQTIFDSFTCTLCSSGGRQVDIETLVVFEDGQGLPVLEDGYVMTEPGTAVQWQILNGNVDYDFSKLSVELLNSPPGTTTINPDGIISFLPNADAVGTITLHYLVEDSQGDTGEATVTIEILPATNDG